MLSRLSTGFAPLFLCLTVMLAPLAALPQSAGAKTRLGRWKLLAMHAASMSWA
jgi:hypothetical protein